MAITKVYSESQSGRMLAANMASKSSHNKEQLQHQDRGHFFKPKFLVVIREPDNSFVLGYN